MNDQHEQARNAISEAALAHEDGNAIAENNWLARAQALSLFSIAESLHEIITWTRGIDQPQYPEPDGRVAEFAVMCSGECVLLPGHDGQCIPPGHGEPYRRCTSIDGVTGRRCQTYAGHGGLHSADIPDPFQATGKFSEWSDETALAVPVTGPMPAVVP